MKNKVILATVFSLVFGFIGMNSVMASGTSGVNLGTASDFAVLSKAGISTTGTTSIVGDIGVSPVAATYITGFALDLPAAGSYATSPIITGKIYAPGYADPTPVKMTTAVSDMETAYTDAMGRAAGVTELGAGNIGGLTLAPGVYKWSSGVTIPTDVTLSGSSKDVWIFQIAQNLDLASAAKINLNGGAKANNIYWIVAGQTTVGTTAVFNGNILDKTAIVFNTGATLNGRALSQTAVTLDSNAVTISTGETVVATEEETPVVKPTPANNNNEENNSNSNTTSNEDSSNDNNEVTTTTTTTVTTNNEEGCSAGNLFNTATGATCTNNSEIAPGCSNGNIFNTSTGMKCTSYIAKTNHNFGSVTLKNGSKGEEVKSLQEFLISQDSKDMELKKFGLDGKFGPVTKAALVKWQLKHGLATDGMFGSKTKAKISALAL